MLFFKTYYALVESTNLEASPMSLIIDFLGFFQDYHNIQQNICLFMTTN